MVYRQNLRAQTAITEIHSIHPDIVFDLSLFLLHRLFFHVKLCRVLVIMCVFISVSVSFELKIMRTERSGRRLFGSVAVITDLWSLSNLIMTI